MQYMALENLSSIKVTLYALQPFKSPISTSTHALKTKVSSNGTDRQSKNNSLVLEKIYSTIVAI